MSESERIYVEGEGSRKQQAKDRFQTALSAFALCAKEASKHPWPESTAIWNEALALVVLGRFEEGCSRCVGSMRKERLEALNNANAHQEYASAAPDTRDFIGHIDMAFQLARIISSQQALEDMRTGLSGKPHSVDEVDVDASSVLEQAVALELIDQSSVDKFMHKISYKDIEAENV